MTFRAVLFDACGVLLHQTNRYHAATWQRRIAFTGDDLTGEIWDAIGDCSATVPAQRQVAERLACRLDIPAELAASLLRDFNTDWQPDSQLVEFVQVLRCNYQTGMITNARSGARFCRVEQFSRYGLDTLLDLVVVSGEEGVAKPAPAIYRLAAERLGLGTGECIFVDDKPENVQAALDVGMDAIHHSDSARTIGLLTGALATS